MEFFKYMIDRLKEKGADHIRVFAGGGGVIVPREIRELEAYGVVKVFSPEDGRNLGLQGIINHMIKACDFPTVERESWEREAAEKGDHRAVARLITLAERDVLETSDGNTSGQRQSTPGKEKLLNSECPWSASPAPAVPVRAP